MIQGILFDKDGTLFDFNATWGAWTRGMLAAEVGDDPRRVTKLANALGYDMSAERFLPGSIVIAETVDVVAQHMLPHLQGVEKPALIARMNAAAASVPQVEATPLVPYFDALLSRRVLLGIATNDAEAPARNHLIKAGVADHFAFIAGYDSGHGAKPGPGQLLAFCDCVGLAPAQCAMVGDSAHDLQAGRAAGMTTIGVLTGPAPRDALAPLADVVLRSIAEIPAFLDQQAQSPVS